MLQRNDKAATVRRVAAVAPRSYARLLGEIKERVQAARVRAGLAVNRELVLLYWHIGRRILEAQEYKGWGAKVVDRLAEDLSRTFPEMRGFSVRNLKYMRAFAEAWPDEPIVQQLAAQIPWFHNCVLLDKLDRPEVRVWYARAAVEYGWSRNVLVHQMPRSGFIPQHSSLIALFPGVWTRHSSPVHLRAMKDPGPARMGG
jgi:predicted nuclease of restriction endonuclease-like (RecB) superfamily